MKGNLTNDKENKRIKINIEIEEKKGESMNNKEDFKGFLRKEAECLQEKVESIEVKMSTIMLKNGLSHLDKINKLNNEKELIKAQIFKLYELIGKIS